jgi:16S rRNA (guanine(966)-N(2))-methyltransferase RsmD
MIRVISGAFKGKRLKMVRSPLVRPMPDKLKGALFNIIQENVKGALVLDGFAGTGSVGIEALSRGAREIVFVEEYLPAARVIEVNLARCEAQDRARVVRREFNRAVIQLAKERYQFDLIFLDPPYELLKERNPLKVIKKREVLKPGGDIVLRHYFKTNFQAKYFDLIRQATIGDDTLSFYK